MSRNFTLAMIAPEAYELEDFEVAGDIWTATSGDTTLSRDTSHASPRESVMKILGNGAAGDADGAYKDFTVVAGMTWFFSCLYKCSAGTLRIQLYDQTNGASISYVDKTETSWSCYETSATIPANCVTVRIKLLQAGSNQGPYYVDDLSFQPNVIDVDADSYTRDPVWVGSLQQNLGGRRVADLRSVHHSFLLHWNYLTEAQFEFLREAFNSAERMYFDDGDVPQMKETGIYRTNETLTFAGITNPSSTHKAYEDNDDAMPTAKGSLETTEFATADYQAFDGDDSNYADSVSSVIAVWDDTYLFHKFCLESGVTSPNTRRFRCKVKCSSDDETPLDKDGCILYGWDATNWTQLDSHTSPDNTELEYREITPAEAAKFVDTGDDYIRLLLRTRGTWSKTGYLEEKAARSGSGYWPARALLEFNSKLYGVAEGVSGGSYLYEWNEVNLWVSKGSDAAKGRGKSLGEYNSTLYLGTLSGELLEWDGSNTLTEKAPISGTHNNIYSLLAYDDGGGEDLYGVTEEGLLQWNGVNAWAEKGTHTDGLCGVVYSGALYTGTASGKVYEWNDVDTLVEKGDCGSDVNALVVFDSELYAACDDGKLYKWNDVDTMTAVTAAYSGVTLESLGVFNSLLYVGTDTGIVLEYDAGNSLLRLKAPTGPLDFIDDLLDFDSELMVCGSHDDDLADLAMLVEYDSSYIRTYYVETEINEDLDNVIHLSHRAILTAGDVVSVKNLTQGTTLTLTTHYTVASDRRSVTVSSGAVDSDEIEVTYNRYWETMFRDVPERWFSGDPSSSRTRLVDLILDTIEGD